MKVVRLFSTVDPAEMSKFAEYKWWSRKNVLHPFSDLRVEFMKSSLSISKFSDLSILDIGCGGGLMTERLARLGGTVTGIDPSDAIDAAQSHLPKYLSSRVNYVKCELADIHEKFDIVLASEVIEHVTDPKLFLQEASEKLKDQGSLFLTTVNKTVESWVLGILVSEYVLGIVEPGTHQWEKFLSPNEINEMGQKLGLQLNTRKGWFLDYCRFQAYFTEYDRLGYLAHFTKHGKTS